MIYNAKPIGANTIIVNYAIPIDSPTFLAVFTGPRGEIKTVLIPNSEDGDFYQLTITGVVESYQDLNSGNVFFDTEGTWSILLHFQASAVNTNPALATVLESFKYQVNGRA